MKTLVISDLHLGARNSMTDYLEVFLKEVPFDRLVLNGDTIDNLNFEKFKPRHWRVLRQRNEVQAAIRTLRSRPVSSAQAPSPGKTCSSSHSAPAPAQNPPARRRRSRPAPISTVV